MVKEKKLLKMAAKAKEGTRKQKSPRRKSIDPTPLQLPPSLRRRRAESKPGKRGPQKKSPSICQG